MKLSHLLIASAAAFAFSAALAQQPDEQTIRQAQERLQQEGLHIGLTDGILGPLTEQSLREFQKREGLPATGKLDHETLSALGIEPPAAAGTTHGSPAEQRRN